MELRMPQTVTLELSDNTLRRAEETAQRTGRTLEAVLAEWIDRASANEAISHLTPDSNLHIYTPFGGEDTAQALFDFMKSEEAKRGE
jgi:hypothetical protein